MAAFKGRSTLRLVQSISTIPSAFPKTLNTCGRICTHQSGRYVVVSNRGHQSITVFRVKMKGPKCGELTTVGHFHTRGETPRHFQFDNSGQYLLVANQDTDSIAVFNFNLSNGELKYSGNEYRVPSPNFVCCCPSHRADSFNEVLSTMEGELVQTGLSSLAQASSIAASVTGSDSDESTLPIARRKKENNNALREELASARREIEELKKLLAEKV
jgi:6-phosphogluconolactonase